MLVPKELSSETFRQFMNIPQRRIDREQAECPGNFDSIWPKLQAFYRLTKEEQTPAVWAEHLHHRMLHACSADAHPQFPACIAVHLGSYGARMVAQLAIQIAYVSGELGRINSTARVFQRSVSCSSGRITDDRAGDRGPWSGVRGIP